MNMLNIRRSGEVFQQGGSLFLQMKLVKLQVSNQQLGAVKISIYKGLQKLDQTPPFHLSANSQHLIDESILNFHIRNFEKKKNITFKVTLESVEEPPREIGTFDIQANNFILPFMKDGVNTFARTDYLTDKVGLEYMLFVERTKTEVEKSMRSYEESKNSARQIELGNEWTITSPAMSEKESIKKPRAEHSQEVQNHNITPHSKKFKKPGAFQTASQKQNISKASNEQLSHKSNKIWFQMEDGEEIVNNLIPRKKGSIIKPVETQPTGTGVKVVGGLALIGIITYLIILLDDMNYGMDLVRGIIEAEIRQNYL